MNGFWDFVVGRLETQDVESRSNLRGRQYGPRGDFGSHHFAFKWLALAPCGLSKLWLPQVPPQVNGRPMMCPRPASLPSVERLLQHSHQACADTPLWLEYKLFLLRLALPFSLPSLLSFLPPPFTPSSPFLLSVLPGIETRALHTQSNCSVVSLIPSLQTNSMAMWQDLNARPLRMIRSLTPFLPDWLILSKVSLLLP